MQQITQIWMSLKTSNIKYGNKLPKQQRYGRQAQMKKTEMNLSINFHLNLAFGGFIK